MPEAPKPLDEQDRLAVLERYRVLDSGREQATDDLVELAAAVTGMPMGSISLVDRDRQWFKARRGLEVDQTPRSASVCAWSILEPEPLVVPDLAADPRFADLPIVVGDPYLRAYAGVPLVAEEGRRIGTLCVFDREPRELTADRVAHLVRLARAVVAHFELRRVADELHEALGRVRTLEALLPVCAWCRRVRVDDDWRRDLQDWLDRHTDVRFTHGICPDCAAVELAEDENLGRD